MLQSIDASTGRRWTAKENHPMTKPTEHRRDRAPLTRDRVLYAARNRIHLSTDGGRFWRSLEPELPDIEALAWSMEP